MPFAGYKNFNDCVRQNKHKENAKAYCASIMHAVEGKAVDMEINENIEHYGDVDWEGHIRVNPKRGDVVNTIIHEKIHAQDMTMPEEKVIELTKKVEASMSLPEMAQVLLDADKMIKDTQPKREMHYTHASKVVKSNINEVDTIINNTNRSFKDKSK